MSFSPAKVASGNDFSLCFVLQLNRFCLKRFGTFSNLGHKSYQMGLSRPARSNKVTTGAFTLGALR